MTHVATLISNPALPAVDDRALARAGALLRQAQAPRWLDPGQHDGSATPDNFINVLHDALIKNYKKELYD